LAAAAIIGAVFLIRSLLPSGNTQKLFSKYYEPFNAVSDITRGISSGGSISFNRAIENYKSGDYLAAETGFSKAILNETLSFSASFFLGITEILNQEIDLKLLNVLNFLPDRLVFTKSGRKRSCATSGRRSVSRLKLTPL
jgi:hypothetical protein